jgi:hypothetical protein
MYAIWHNYCLYLRERYLSNHRGAADTAEGIARWWLTSGVDESELTQVAAALDLLIQRGVVSRRLLPDGNCVYAAASPRAAPTNDEQC